MNSKSWRSHFSRAARATRRSRPAGPGRNTPIGTDLLERHCSGSALGAPLFVQSSGSALHGKQRFEPPASSGAGRLSSAGCSVEPEAVCSGRNPALASSDGRTRPKHDAPHGAPEERRPAATSHCMVACIRKISTSGRLASPTPRLVRWNSGSSTIWWEVLPVLPEIDDQVAVFAPGEDMLRPAGLARVNLRRDAAPPQRG